MAGELRLVEASGRGWEAAWNSLLLLEEVDERIPGLNRTAATGLLIPVVKVLPICPAGPCPPGNPFLNPRPWTPPPCLGPWTPGCPGSCAFPCLALAHPSSSISSLPALECVPQISPCYGPSANTPPTFLTANLTSLPPSPSQSPSPHVPRICPSCPRSPAPAPSLT